MVLQVSVYLVSPSMAMVGNWLIKKIESREVINEETVDVSVNVSS